MSERTDLERAIARAFRPDKRMSRRSFMRQTGRGALVAGSTLSITSILAACGIRPGIAPRRAPRRASDATGALEWANWPLYIDIDDDGNYPSLVAFTEESGLEVNYTEAIQDNADFMGVILPDLQAGQRHRLGHHHARWLGGRTSGSARGARGAGPQPAAELDGERGRLRQGPLVRPRQQVQPVVAGRHHRDCLRSRAHRPRDHDVRRPARPGLCGRRGRVQRHARHVRAHAAVPRRGAGKRDGRRRHSCARQAARGQRPEPVPGLLRQRVLRRTGRAATSRSRSPGRATSRRCS